MLKTKIFAAKNGKELVSSGSCPVAGFELEINQWLEENQNIEIVSANCPAGGSAWGYIILYKEI